MSKKNHVRYTQTAPSHPGLLYVPWWLGSVTLACKIQSSISRFTILTLPFFPVAQYSLLTAYDPSLLSARWGKWIASLHSRTDVTLPTSCRPTIAPAPCQLLSHSISNLIIFSARAVCVGCSRVGMFVRMYVVRSTAGQDAIEAIGVELELILNPIAEAIVAFLELVAPRQVSTSWKGLPWLGNSRWMIRPLSRWSSTYSPL